MEFSVAKEVEMWKTSIDFGEEIEHFVMIG
jgi:hypothetical protein